MVDVKNQVFDKCWHSSEMHSAPYKNISREGMKGLPSVIEGSPTRQFNDSVSRRTRLQTRKAEWDNGSVSSRTREKSLKRNWNDNVSESAPNFQKVANQLGRKPKSLMSTPGKSINQRADAISINPSSVSEAGAANNLMDIPKFTPYGDDVFNNLYVQAALNAPSVKNVLKEAGGAISDVLSVESSPECGDLKLFGKLTNGSVIYIRGWAKWGDPSCGLEFAAVNGPDLGCFA